MSSPVIPTASQVPDPDRRKMPRRLEDRRLLQKERELEAARRMTQVLFEHLHPDELGEKTLTTALEVVGAESGSLLLANPDSRELVFRQSLGPNPVSLGTTIPWDKGIAGAVFQSGEPMVIGDVKQDERHFAEIDSVTDYVTRDMITLPLKRWEGEAIGVLQIMNKREGRLDEEDVAILTIMSAIASSSIEQARLFEEAKLAVVARMLGDIGHDIKNMLMPVLSGADFLKEELDEQFPRLVQDNVKGAKASYANSLEMVRMIVTNARRIHGRVREIADAVKGVTSPPNFAPCQIAGVVDGVFDALRTFAGENGITLQKDSLDNLPVIQADEHRLFNAFFNLINNAIAEVPRGGSISVFGKEEVPGVGILVSVSDTGRGMPPEVRDRLFTAQAISTKKEGTGLGTKIVKDVVDAHGGRISVESEIGVGTTFYMYLPVQPPSFEEAKMEK